MFVDASSISAALYPGDDDRQLSVRLTTVGKGRNRGISSPQAGKRRLMGLFYRILRQPDLKMMQALHRQRLLLFNAGVFLLLPPIARFLTHQNNSLAETTLHILDQEIIQIPINVARIYFSSTTFLLSYLICFTIIAVLPILRAPRDAEIKRLRQEIIASKAQQQVPSEGSEEVTQHATEAYERALTQALLISFVPRIAAFLAICCAFYFFVGVLLSQMAAVAGAIKLGELFGLF